MYPLKVVGQSFLSGDVSLDAIPMTLANSKSEGLILYADTANSLSTEMITAIQTVAGSLSRVM